jgi:hypothetical protein
VVKKRSRFLPIGPQVLHAGQVSNTKQNAIVNGLPDSPYFPAATSSAASGISSLSLSARSAWPWVSTAARCKISAAQPPKLKRKAAAHRGTPSHAKLLSTIRGFKDTLNPNAQAARLAFKRLRIRQLHENTASRTWHELIGTDRGDTDGLRFALSRHHQESYERLLFGNLS